MFNLAISAQDVLHVVTPTFWIGASIILIYAVDKHFCARARRHDVRGRRSARTHAGR